MHILEKNIKAAWRERYHNNDRNSIGCVNDAGKKTFYKILIENFSKFLSIDLS